MLLAFESWATTDMSRARFRLASSPHPLTPRDDFAAGLCIRPRVLAQVVAGLKVLLLDRLMAYYKPYARRRCCGRARDLDGAEDSCVLQACWEDGW